MKRIYRLIPLAAAILLVPSVATSQAINTRSIIREKLKVLPEHLRESQQAESPAGLEEALRKFLSAGQEMAVSNDSSPESEVHAAINPTDSNNIVVSPIRYAGQSFTTPIYYTKDFGKSWKKSSFNPLPTESAATILGGGDPLFAFDANGRLYYSWINLYAVNFDFSDMRWALSWAYSDDGGATWMHNASMQIAFSSGISLVGGGNAAIYDKQWLVCDLTNGPRRNTLYAAFLEGGLSGEEVKIGLRVKPPGDAPFTTTSTRVSGEDFKQVQFTSIQVDRGGGVHVSFFGTKDDKNWAMWHTVSTDGGTSFPAANKISDVVFPGQFDPELAENPNKTMDSITGILAQRMYPCPHIAIDNGTGPHAGTIYAVWTANGITSKLSRGLDIYYSRSGDNGTTWSPAVVLNNNNDETPTSQFYPSISVSPQGFVAVTWYDRRSDTRDRNTSYYMTYSFDGGATFINDFAVTAAVSDFATVGRRNGGFGVGEYTQVLTTSGYAIPVWADGRTGNGDLNILAAFVPLSPEGGISGVERSGAVTAGMNIRRLELRGEQLAIDCTVDHAISTRLHVVNMLGQEVATVDGGLMPPGEHVLLADLSGLPSGRYFVRLEGESGVVSASFVLAR
ncbi:MAG: exo-alpha-sialidase [Armatimonadetes bacterium]|nr:exo-alpha-sialidase [Armatimonadota bacterium]